MPGRTPPRTVERTGARQADPFSPEPGVGARRRAPVSRCPVDTKSVISVTQLADDVWQHLALRVSEESISGTVSHSRRIRPVTARFTKKRLWLSAPRTCERGERVRFSSRAGGFNASEVT